MFPMDNATAIAERVHELYRIVDELERMHPGRKFSLDGHLVGSIGEVLAAQMYDLVLLPASAERTMQLPTITGMCRSKQRKIKKQHVQQSGTPYCALD